MPDATIVSGRADYLYVQFETRVLKFVDDTEFWFDQAGWSGPLRVAGRAGTSA
jgi:uncharacterized protein (DUF1499 family)